MARWTKTAKRATVLRRKRLYQSFSLRLKSSFFVRSMVLQRLIKLSNVLEEHARKPRTKGRKRSTEWCEKDMQEMGEEEFIANFRLSRPSFYTLCTILGPHIVKKDTFAGNTVSVERRVAITLYFLGQGINYRTVANQFGVAVPTVCQIVLETTKAIVGLTSDYIKFPESDAEYVAAMATFQGKQIPNCVGAIDGSHIKILRPTKCGTDYFNRKAYYSILLQGICDGDGKFLSVSCGYPGSIHDARMMRRSGFYKNVLNKRYLINRMHKDLPLVILGDSAYPKLPWLLVPYAGTNLSRPKSKFNFAHSSTRIIIENAFGQLKGRFRVLSKQVDIATCKVDQIVVACCILHNFCIKEKEEFPEDWLIDDEAEEQSDTDHEDIELDVNEEGQELDGDTCSTQDQFLQFMFNE